MTDATATGQGSPAADGIRLSARAPAARPIGGPRGRARCTDISGGAGPAALVFHRRRPKAGPVAPRTDKKEKAA